MECHIKKIDAMILKQQMICIGENEWEQAESWRR